MNELDGLQTQELIYLQESQSTAPAPSNSTPTNTEGAITGISSATLTVGARSEGVQNLELPQDLRNSATPSFAGAILGTLKVGGGPVVKKIVSASGALNFPGTAAQSSSDLTLAVADAKVGDFVIPSMPSPPANSCWVCIGVLADGQVTFRFNNYSAAPIDPGSADFSVLLFNFT